MNWNEIQGFWTVYGCIHCKSFIGLLSIARGEIKAGVLTNKSQEKRLYKRTMSRVNFIVYFWTASRRWNVMGKTALHMREQ